ncbi:MAG TPA: XrtA/PEP-CTERM system histidine kinase PrsK [Stellaceae bacterium]|nr:XrtA/PEP-CTERM system histidine kinase PrsK [Stellaceae bacterium]
MISATLGVALYAAAGAAYAFLLLLLVLSRRASRTRTVLAAACAATALWAGASALGWGFGFGLCASFVELLGIGAWCVFLLHLLRRQAAGDPRSFRVLAGCGVAVALALPVLAWADTPGGASAGLLPPMLGEPAARLALAIFGLLLTENLYRNTAPEFRWHINFLVIGLGGMLVYGVVLYADALMFRRISPVLWDGRAVAMIMATPLLAVAAARNRDWAIDIHVSRTVVFHTTTLIASGVFLLALAVTAEVFRMAGSGWGVLAEMTLVIAGITALAVLLVSGSARSRLTRILAENFYSYRYDYRREWLKCTEILTAAPGHGGLQTRVIRAVAEIADSPAGVLWVRDLDGAAFHWAGSWNRPAVAAPEPAAGPFVALFRDGSEIVELTRLDAPPRWLDEIAQAWIAVPLAQQDRVIGFVVLARPRAPLKLDRETRDLLRIVACQAATHLAEQQYAQALGEARQLADYSKRFAFAVHDMKNVASQLAMIVQNAPLHRGVPEFHEDVLATVQAALDRMNRVLATLRARELPQVAGLVAPLALIQEEIAALRRRGLAIDCESDGYSAAVAMDADDFRSVIVHLCENAAEASPGFVKIRVRHEPLRVAIDIIDKGAGMTPEFIRDRLFQPFASTKRDGLGIGTYQARELLRAAGGDLLVTSRPGHGTTMRILLPCISRKAEPASLPTPQVA